MAYNQQLAQRIRDVMDAPPWIVEKKMFGGLAFLLNGNMACGIVGDELMVRVGAAQHDEALAQPHARAMDFTGRPMKGMIFVDAEGVATDELLRSWVERGVRFASALPAKM
jgi:TfoX/Sxy family transcriptional regulator of competence genes